MTHFPKLLRSLPTFEGPFDAFKLEAKNCDVLFASYPADTTIPAHSSCHRVAPPRFWVLRESKGTPKLARRWYGLVRNWEQSAQHCYSDVNWRQTSETPGLMMKVYVEDVDKHFVHAKAEGARIVSEPENGFWGGRIYRVLDHEGHQWEISQRGRDLAADRWQLHPNVTRSVLE